MTTPATKEDFERLEAAIDRLDVFIRGNDEKPGLAHKVTVLEAIEDKRSKFHRLIGVSVLGLVVKAGWDIIKYYTIGG